MWRVKAWRISMFSSRIERFSPRKWGQAEGNQGRQITGLMRLKKEEEGRTQGNAETLSELLNMQTHQETILTEQEG